MRKTIKQAFFLLLLCVVAMLLTGGCQKQETLPSTFVFTDQAPAEETPAPTEDVPPVEAETIPEETKTDPVETEMSPAEPAENPAATEEIPGEPEAFTPEFCFSTTDRDGNPVTEEIFRESKLTMLNFWESWCGPCVGEMPELERLQKDYADRGFRLYGITSSASNEADVEDVIQYTGVTYPMLRYCDAFDCFQTGYVPTTVFIDQYGHIAGDIQVGSASYETWASKIDSLLGN